VFAGQELTNKKDVAYLKDRAILTICAARLGGASGETRASGELFR